MKSRISQTLSPRAAAVLVCLQGQYSSFSREFSFHTQDLFHNSMSHKNTFFQNRSSVASPGERDKNNMASKIYLR